jgi:alternate signal-mediated exported protein
MKTNGLKTNENAKSSKQKRIMVGAFVVAAVITFGATFAWLSSKDAVTNKLTANAENQVVITEEFNPPSNWVPGSEVKKKVSVTNTGSIDAAVQITLQQRIELHSTEDVDFNSDNIANYVSLDLNDPLIQALKAGGQLITLEYDRDSKTYNQSATSTDLVGTDYVPTKTGIYLFRRNGTIESDVIDENIDKYVGFYYVASENGIGSYYELSAVKNEDGVFTIKAKQDVVDDVAAAATEETTTTKNESLTFDYTKVSNNVIDAKYCTDVNNHKDGDDIIIHINLDSDWETYWTFNATDKEFYYKKVLKAGASSERLIKSMTLDEESVGNYDRFEYYLTVLSDSRQIIDEIENDKKVRTIVGNDTWNWVGTISDNAIAWDARPVD